MKQVGYRERTYTKRHWRCAACGRSGFVLIHRTDTQPKADERRAASHNAQVRRDRCRGLLRWFTTSEELTIDPEFPV